MHSVDLATGASSILHLAVESLLSSNLKTLNEPRCEKTGLRGFRPGPTQTGLYSYRR